MRHEINSPILPMRFGPMPDRALRNLDGLGAAIDLLCHLPWHGQINIATLVPLVMHALADGRIHFALTEEDKPWGLAVCHWLDDRTHQNWLRNPPSLNSLSQEAKPAAAALEPTTY